MSIDQTLTTSFFEGVLLGVHNFAASGGHTFRLALYSPSATLGASTTAYSATNEVSGTGYTAGGLALTNLGVSSVAGTAYVSFSTASWPSASFSVTRGGLIYNDTATGNPSVCVLDFGANKTPTGNTFSVTFPAATSSTAIIRIGLS